jgi:hypothetical protein
MDRRWFVSSFCFPGQCLVNFVQISAIPETLAHIRSDMTHHFRLDCGTEDLFLPITDINLCVNFASQGICDEQYGLTIIPAPAQRYPTEPPRANHFSLWLGFGGNNAVMLDVTQRCPPSDPYAASILETSQFPAVVRLCRKTIPTDDDMGCVLRELGVRAGTTINDILQLILSRSRHLYSFRPVHKQQAGCRYWIHLIAQDLEDVGITGKGYAGDVLQCLETYYSRYPLKLPSGRWEQGGNWGPRPEFRCAPLVPGSFH